MTKTNKILLAIFAVQAALVLLIQGSSSSYTLATSKMLIDDSLKVEDITKVEVFGKSADDGDNKPALAFTRGGETWTLTSHYDYPAKSDSVDGLLDKVLNLRSRGPFSSDKERHARDRVADAAYDRKVVLHTASKQYTLFVGTSDFKRTKVRVAGQDAIHRLATIRPSDLSERVAEWVDPVFLSVNVADVVGMVIKNANGEFNLARNEGKWSLTSAEAPPSGGFPALDQKKVDDLVKKIEKLNFQDIVGGEAKPEFGLDKPAAEITLSLQEVAKEADNKTPVPQTVQLFVGAEKDYNRFVKQSGVAHLVSVGSYAVKDFVDLKLAGLTPDPPAEDEPSQP